MSFLQVTGADLAAIAPELILAGMGTLLVLLDAFAKSLRKAFPYLALLAVGLAAFAPAATSGPHFGGAVETSGLTTYIELLAYTGVALAILGGAHLLTHDGRNQGEFYALLLWSAAGLILMVKGSDLLIAFIGLELMSLSLYVMAAWYRTIPASVEAGMKYFLMGAFASAFLLYGVAIIYGRLGTTRLDKLLALTRAEGSGMSGSPAIALGSPPGLDVMLQIAILAILAAFAFKIALVPFHAWAPDVYQGTTTPAVAFLSTAPKAGAAIVLLRVLHALFPAGFGDPWRTVLAILAILSILFGNIVALAQRDVKRMLAYSGIAQMGYLAIAFATFSNAAFEGALVFLAGYLATNAAAFLTVGAISNGESEPHFLADLQGRGKERPLAAAVLTLSMLSLTGVPPTIGFLGKLLVFRSAVDADLVPLALVGVFGSIVSAGYYLRVVYYLWMKDSYEELRGPGEDVMSGAAHLLAAVAMLVLGLFPGALLGFVRSAAGALSLTP